jgi:hypothetical protein
MNAAWSENGNWWLPANSKASAVGLLQFDPRAGIQGGNATRASDGYHSSSATSDFGANTFRFSLYVPWPNHNLARGEYVIMADIDVRTLFKNHHFGVPEDAVFRRCSCTYANLYTWLSERPGLEAQEIPNEPRTFRVRHSRGTIWQTAVAGGFIVSNDFSRLSCDHLSRGCRGSNFRRMPSPKKALVIALARSTAVAQP